VSVEAIDVVEALLLLGRDAVVNLAGETGATPVAFRADAGEGAL
jgi:hypothetical protein